uniref:Uncharacterized protein n=1 Tax=Fagus sylvatica TaxID=28930 RepID=A0A2N9GG79_FAGSY
MKVNGKFFHPKPASPRTNPPTSSRSRSRTNPPTIADLEIANRDPPPLATVTHLEPVSLSHPGDRTVADLEIAVTHRLSQAVTHLEPVSLSHPIWFSVYPLRRA